MADNATFSLSATWSVPLDQAQSVAAALQMLVGSTRKQPGCEGCQVTTELGDAAVIHYLERWKTESDLQRQVRSARFSSLAELLERATEAPVVRFSLEGITRGLDYADEVRRQR
jgi:quinol monooxygenase YgiN